MKGRGPKREGRGGGGGKRRRGLKWEGKGGGGRRGASAFRPEIK